MAMAAMDHSGGDGDIWWYVCRLCYRAFAEGTLKAVRTHIWNAHNSKDAANVLILSQTADLEPKVKILPFPERNTANNIDRCRTRGCRNSALVKREPIGDDHVESVSKSEVETLVKTIKCKTSKRRRTKKKTDSRRRVAPTTPTLDFDQPTPQASLSSQPPSPTSPEGQVDALDCSLQLEPLPVILVKEEILHSDAPDAHSPPPSPLPFSNWLPGDEEWEPEPEIEVPSPAEEIPSSRHPLNVEELAPSNASNSKGNAEKQEAKTRSRRRPKLPKSRSKSKIYQPQGHLCHICSKSYRFKHLLINHMRTVHPGDLRQELPSCPTCQKICTSKRGLQLHRKAVHSGKVTAVTGSPLRCGLCSRVCSTQQKLLVHERTHSPADVLCPDCGKMFKSAWRLGNHQQLIHSGTFPFKCSKCDAAFKCPGSLKRHEAAHVEGRPFLCSQCPNTFKTELHLKEHIRVRHKRVKPVLTCRVCKKVFTGKQTLRSHEFEVHDFQRGWTRYKCPFCPRQFAEKMSLRVHLPKHSSERPFKCEHPGCGKTYKFAFHLKDHATIHLAYEDLPRECNLCRAKFGTTQQVRDHKRKVHGVVLAKRPKPQQQPMMAVEVGTIMATAPATSDPALAEPQQQPLSDQHDPERILYQPSCLDQII